MTDKTMLPGFDNIATCQLDEDRLVLALDNGNPDDTTACVILKRSDYDSDQEFMMEGIQWARRNGGREVPA